MPLSSGIDLCVVGWLVNSAVKRFEREALKIYATETYDFFVIVSLENDTLLNYISINACQRQRNTPSLLLLQSN